LFPGYVGIEIPTENPNSTYGSHTFAIMRQDVFDIVKKEHSKMLDMKKVRILNARSKAQRTKTLAKQDQEAADLQAELDGPQEYLSAQDFFDNATFDQEFWDEVLSSLVKTKDTKQANNCSFAKRKNKTQQHQSNKTLTSDVQPTSNDKVISCMYEMITSNTSSVRKETLNGTEYLVAPASMLVPGVLNGSRGALFYPKDEVLKNVEAWNMMPLTLGHPNDDAGNPASARRPDIIEKYGLGFVFNATGKNGKLDAEAWFDIRKVNQVSPIIIERLERNEAIELSTGLFTDNTAVKNGGDYKGRKYTHIARNYRPDHLAVLVDTKGACSREDGCGIALNKKVGCSWSKKR